MTTKTMQIKLAKATKEDFNTMWSFFRHVQHLESHLDYSTIQEPNFEYLEAIEKKHLALMGAHYMRNQGALSRVLMGAETLMSDVNNLIDPEADHLAIHPRIAKALDLLDKIESEQYLDILKPHLMGEYSQQLETSCSACSFDIPDEDCEVCGGEIYYMIPVNIEWNTIKDVLKDAFEALLPTEAA